MDLLLPALIMPVISAYIILTLFLPTRFFILRLANNHLILQLIVVGLVLLSFTSVIYPFFEAKQFSSDGSPCFFTQAINSLFFHPVLFLKDIIQNGIEAIEIVSADSKKRHVPDLSGITSLLFSLSVYFSTISLLVEFRFKKMLRPYIDKIFINSLAGKILYEISRLLYAESAALVTMNNGKVYVGYFIHTPNIGSIKKEFSLVPLYSGYRDEKQHMRLTNDYKELSELANSIGPEHEVSSIIISTDDDKELARMSPVRLKQVIRSAYITMRCTDIFSISEWVPELYNIQSEDSSQVAVR